MPALKNLRGLWPPAVIAIAGVAAYANSLSGPLVFDDLPSIADNPTIRHLWPLWQALRAPAGGTTGGRPVMNLSYAVNYALGGVNVWGYHALNLLIHILAGLTLFGIVRRSLGILPKSSREHGLEAHATSDRATFIAFAVALIWTVHPLQTEAVTYISERAESLMGLFYLLTLYFFIRSVDTNEKSRRGGPASFLGGTRRNASSTFSGLHVSGFKFQAFSVAACLFGVATKEVLVTAPVMVLLYDRTFVSGTFREAWRRRWKYYAGLGCSWILSGYLMMDLRQRVVGLDHAGNWWEYALTESRVILRYLALAVWPHPLVFDYGIGTAPQTWAVAPYVAVVLLLLGATLWMLFCKIPNFEIRTERSDRYFISKSIGFLGAWVFITLAPTSSVVPLWAQPMAESRMYLPLAAVVAVVVLGIHALLGSSMGCQPMSSQGQPRLRRGATFIALAAVAAACIFLTVQRNNIYRSNESLWSDTVAKRPANARAHCSLGNALNAAGRIPEAIVQYQEALRLNPDDPEARCDLGNALNATGHTAEAVAQYEEALRLDPDYVEAHCNLANALNAEGHTQEAIAQNEEALRLKPDYPEAHNNLGSELELLPGRLGEAIAQYEEALRLRPDYAEAHNNLGDALNAAGHTPEAIAQYEEALRLRSNYAEAHYSLGNALIAAGRTGDAIAQYAAAVRLKPDYAEARNNLGNALNTEGRTEEAIAQYEVAARLKPDQVAVQMNLAIALLKVPGRTNDAAAHLEAVLRLEPDNDAARQILDRIRAIQP